MDGGRAFGTLLREMADIGYRLCWKCDAQHFGVPHRRRRVLFVGHIGTDSECCAKVLFDLEGRSYILRRLDKRKDSTSKAEEGTGDYNRQIFRCLQTTCGDHSRCDNFNMIELGDRLRKLTPLECERLHVATTTPLSNGV